MKLLLLISLVLAPFCLALGIVLPLARFETLYVFDQSPSLVAIIVNLASDQDWVLAAIVLVVSIIFPLLKMLVMVARALDMVPAGGRAGRALPHLARWSLMDVLLVAIVIVAAKTGGIASALSQSGLWFYAGSAVLAVIAHTLLDRVGPAASRTPRDPARLAPQAVAPDRPAD
ncbi:paraquat-inducible protein A [Hoeflea marina]|uniref:paraquat-inducible protein A n=1 Tax=Hoeflea marina TaxID=274592 RepID=UPI001FE129E2|nr:paraquat-inducible protein A [Hoeflea marina]